MTSLHRPGDDRIEDALANDDGVSRPVEGGWASAWSESNSHMPITVNKKILTAARANEDVKTLARDVMFPAVLLTMTSFILGTLITQFSYTKFIPETLSTLFVAMALGGIIRKMLNWGWVSLGAFTVMDATILNLFLLPIIIFEGGWSVNLPHFMSQFPYILVFAILGTIISIVVIGSLSWAAALHGLHPMTSFRGNFAFASLISATDPVATLTTFSQLQIATRQPLLNTLVFGESFINDAVAIVFFNAFNHTNKEAWDDLLMRVFTLLLVSMLLGLVASALLILVLRFAKLPGSTLPEVLYVFLTPYLVYSLAESLDFSGIIATLFSGILMRLYGARHLSRAGEENADRLLEIMARLADSGVFIICGTSAALMTSVQGFRYGLLALALCLAARAVAVSVCTALSNRMKAVNGDCGDDHLITWRHQFMIWLSGLRGGLGLVLALEIDETWCGMENKLMILNTTFFLVCALLLICGATTEPCLRLLHLLPPEEQPSADAGVIRIASGAATASSSAAPGAVVGAAAAAPAPGAVGGLEPQRTRSAIRLESQQAGPLHRTLTWVLVGGVGKQ